VRTRRIKLRRHEKKFVANRPFADPDAAARKIIEIANGVETEQDGRIYIERVNARFLQRKAVATTSAPGSSAPSHSAGYGCTRAAPTRGSQIAVPRCLPELPSTAKVYFRLRRVP
jgi:hypothetical protein